MVQLLLFIQCDRLLRLSALTKQNSDRRQFRYDFGGWLIAYTGSTGGLSLPNQSRAPPTPNGLPKHNNAALLSGVVDSPLILRAEPQCASRPVERQR